MTTKQQHQFQQCLEEARRIVASRRAEAPDGFDPQNTFAAVAVGVVAVGASVATGVMSADASRHAANQAKDSQEQANNLNYQQFLQSRGSKGSAVLPTYLTNPANGQPFEGGVLGSNAVKAYQDAYNALPPDQQIAQTKAILAQFQPTILSANQTAQGIFNGDIENQQLGAEAPVATARQAGVTARKEATLESLASTLNDINAIQAGKGYTGDSFGSRLMKGAAMRSAATTNANDQAGVNLTTAQEQSGIKLGAINTRLSSLQLPYAMVQNDNALTALPQNTALDQEARRQQLFNFFKIGPGQFQYQPLPTQAATINPLGYGTAALSGIASSYGDKLAKQQLAKSIPASSPITTPSTATSDPFAGDPEGAAAALGG